MATVITNSVLNGLRTTFSAAFWNVFQNTPAWYDKITTSVPSSSGSNTYGWVMNSFAMREWIGPRVVQNIQEHEFQVPNKIWEETAKLRRVDVADDNLGVFSKWTLPNLAAAAKKQPDTRLAAQITLNGVGPTCFDGNPFFYASHPTYNNTGTGATTYSNIQTGTGLDQDGVSKTRALMASYIGENGLPLGVVGNLIVCPPQLEVNALVVAHSLTYAVPTSTGGIGPTTNSATVDNPLRGKVEVLMVPELAIAPNVWYLMDTTKPVRPFIYQPRDELELVARFNPEDPEVFNLDTYVWGARVRNELTVSLPYLCVQSTT
jgi:phage major head subunit gpT-like protein